MNPDKYYFTGKPCKNGHISNREKANRTCCTCLLEIKRRAQSLRRARFRNSEGSFTAQEIQNLLKTQRYECTYCLRDLRETGYQIDHVMPLSRGGSNWIKNIQLLCPDDNRYKNASTNGEYLLRLIVSA